MISGLIHKLSGTDQLNDFRFTMKTMAYCLRSDHRIPQDRRYFMRRVTNDICEGSPTLRDVSRWYYNAIELVKN